MSRIDSSVSNTTPGGSKAKPTDMRELSMDHFLQLMITELQNQDPMDPMENSEMLQQISQIREIGATDQLRESLEMMQQHQGLSTASGLIGKQVQALDDKGYVYFGVVKSVQITPNDDGSREMTLKVDTGEETTEVKIDDVYAIMPAQTQVPPPANPGEDPDDSGTDPDPEPDDETGEPDETAT